MLRVGIVNEHNMLAAPAQNARGELYPRHYVWVRKLWLATPTSPDPITAHPIPVFINRQHKDDGQEWNPLPVGTRVLVAEVDKTPINREGLAVVAFGPMTDATFEDTRETSYYRLLKGGNIDKIITAPTDPVGGANEDYGRTHMDGDGMGWQTRRPFDSDPTRRQMQFGIPSITALLDHRTDDSTIEATFTVAGGVTYTFKFDAHPARQNVELSDSKGNSFKIDSLANAIEVNAMEAVSITVVSGDVDISAADGDVNVTASGGASVSADGDVSVAAGGDVNVTASSTVGVDAPSIELAGAAAGVARKGDWVQVDPVSHWGKIMTGSAITTADGPPTEPPEPEED